MARDHLRIALAGPSLHQPLAGFRRLADGYTLPPAAGGLVWQLAHDLAARHHDVALVTLDRAAPRPTRLHGAGMPIVVGRHRPAHTMRDLMRIERLDVRDAVRDIAPDLVHAHWCYEYALGALASGIPTLVTVHDWIPAIIRHMELKYWPYWCGRGVMYLGTLLRARHLTANSPYMAGRVRRLARGAVEVVPNGVPDYVFLDPDGSPRRTGPFDAPRFISVNNGFSPLKNVQSLLRAFSSLRARHSSARLDLVGDDYEPGGACHQWARRHGLAAGIRFLGRLPRPRLLGSLSSYVALVHPSKEESFGMTLVEAMARRVAVIGGARSGAVPWVLAGGKAGLLVDVGDPRDLCLAMEALLTSPALRSELGEAGHRHARRQFVQSRVTALYLDTYERLLAEEGRRC